MSTFFFIHGAFHGGWCWSGVKSVLERNGRLVFAPDLPGSGEDMTNRRGITLDTYYDFVSSIFGKEDLRDVILVGHSMGAATVTRIAEKYSSKISKLIIVAGIILDGGECLFDNIPLERKDLYLDWAKKSGENTVPVNPSLIRTNFLNKCNEETILDALSRLTPQPIETYKTKVTLKSFKNLSIPSIYIVCSEDYAIPKESIEKYTKRLTKNSKIIQLESNHEPMLQKPIEFAKLLESL